MTFLFVFSHFQELVDIRQNGSRTFRDIQVDETNILTWQGLIVPVSVDKYIMIIFRYGDKQNSVIEI